MRDFAKSVLLGVTLALTATPVVNAETLGTNPRPPETSRAEMSTLEVLVFVYLGISRMIL